MIMDCGGLQNVSGLCINLVKCLRADRLIDRYIRLFIFARVGKIYRGYAGRSVVFGDHHFINDWQKLKRFDFLMGT